MATNTNAIRNKPKRRYIRGFDGLRTLGVIGVILYHLRPDLFRGGYLGVPIFMVVSGYLITDGLLMEYGRTHRIDLKLFFTKRIKRLYPGLIAVLFATSAYIVLFQQNLLHNLHLMVATNLAYVYNWWQILNGQSYFARYADGESPFTHLWTLSIEGQFYLVWPFLVLAMLYLIKHREQIFNVVFVLAVVSGVWMFVLYHNTASGANFDPSRLYYGTDTRVFSILLGAALAFLWPSAKLSESMPTTSRLFLDGVGTVSLAGMLVMVFFVDSQSAFLYEGGMFLFSLLTMMLVAVVAHPAAHFDRLLSNPVFSYIGSRSYGIYLYQFPVMIFFESRFRDVADHPVLYPVIEVAIILALTELSYRFIEQPIAHFDFRQTGAYLKALVTPSGKMRISRRVVSYLALIILAVGLVGVAKAPGAKDTADDSPLARQLKKNKADEKQKAKELAAARSSIAAARSESESIAKDKSASISVSQSQSRAEESKAAEHPVNQDLQAYGLTQVQLQRAQTIGITGIGDSVMLDGKPILQRIFPKAFIDATVSRQMVDSIGTVKHYAATGALANIVLIGLGTNGPFSTAQFDDMVQAIGKDHQVFWINVHVPTRTWQNDVNSTLASEAKKYPNLTVIDWYDYAKSHRDWFYDDLVHMNPTGNPYYASLIAKAILAK
ncbi:acyltransferase family protein [Lacticaseibacillus yichunensis]|uniref:Acyltransferase family protein n=1 Tax=Lacticaseibacillus yichunensis TaxID=2486015 RepID=A0ABW4CPD7_9LACO|nr:acyltransferase family protein [Lacticaseibacillus yichunensis]